MTRKLFFKLVVGVIWSVVNSCLITASPLDFGSTGRLKAELIAESALSVRCTNSAAYRIKLDGGMYGSIAERRMRHESDASFMKYSLFLDSARARLWGDGSGGSDTYLGVGTGNLQNISVFGMVPMQDSARPGRYSDQVTAIIEF